MKDRAVGLRRCDAAEPCVITVALGANLTCTLALPGTARGQQVREAVAHLAALDPKLLRPYALVRVAPVSRRWWQRRCPCSEWSVWDEEVLPLCTLQRGGAAIVLRLCKLRQPPWQTVGDDPSTTAMTAFDFSEARIQFVRGDFPLTMCGVLDLAAGLLQLLYGVYDCAVHTPSLVRTLLRELMPPSRLRPPGPRMWERAIVDALLERHRRQGAQFSPHQLRVQWLQLLQSGLSTVGTEEWRASHHFFSGLRPPPLKAGIGLSRPCSRIAIGPTGIVLLDADLRAVVRIPWGSVRGWAHTGRLLELVVERRAAPLRLRTSQASQIAATLLATRPSMGTAAPGTELLAVPRPASLLRSDLGHGTGLAGRALEDCDWEEPAGRITAHPPSLSSTVRL